MIIGWWNVRGFSKALKQKEVGRFLKEHKVSVFGLLETKLEEGRLFDIMRWQFQNWHVVHNFHLHKAGRMAIIWNPALFHLDLLYTDPQVIHVRLRCVVTTTTVLASFVYGMHSLVGRRPLWQTLKYLSSTLDSLWVVLGDFNRVLYGNDIGVLER